MKSTLPLINLDPPLPTSGRMSRGRLGREILINYSLDLTLEIYSGKVVAVAATCDCDRRWTTEKSVSYVLAGTSAPYGMEFAPTGISDVMVHGNC